ncbi:hypothetical protein C8Q75DRAFT_764113 [Abortiporus biennis]|nr:hypothetical protein C8Q75DRAFT_764113 [Abortiporus biennis]
MAGILLDKAYLTAIWLETMFYGMNFVLFWSCLFILTVKRRTPKINKLLVSIAIAMFTFSSVHVSLGFQRLIEGFITRRNQTGGPAAFFSDVSIPGNVVKVGIHTVNSIIGDSVVVWRCWLVWSKDWKMTILPIALVTASAVCGFAQTVYFARAKAAHSAFAHTLQIWNGSLFGLSLATNVVVTTLIAVRVWYLLRVGGGASNFRYWRILLIVIESGMIYSTALVCEITLYFLTSNAFYIVYDPIAQLTAITPTMILILAGLELTSNDVHSKMTKVSQPVFHTGIMSSSGTQSTLETMQFRSPTFISDKSTPGVTTFEIDVESSAASAGAVPMKVMSSSPRSPPPGY